MVYLWIVNVWSQKEINVVSIDLGVDDLLVHSVIRAQGLSPRVQSGDQRTARASGQLEFKLVVRQ